MYQPVLLEVLKLFGEGIKESLTRTMADYLQGLGGPLANNQKTQLEKDVASRMVLHKQSGGRSFCHSSRISAYVP